MALVVNPQSQAAPDPDELEQRLARDGAEIAITAIGELDSGGAQIAGADRIAVAGGDGSIGPCAQIAQELGIPLAVIPVGTANDFARAKGLPLDLDEACALARQPDATTSHADLAEIDGRPFVNAASAGLSVIAAREARAHKSSLGPLAYAVGALEAGRTASPLRCRVLCDGDERYAGRVWQVVVGVTGAFGGGSEIGDSAERRLDVAVVPAGSRLGLVRRAYAMRAGKLTAQDDVAHLRGKVIDVEGDGQRAFNVDGELCDCAPAHVTLRPPGFAVVTP
jgi:YegS/Rv2252/BmrU family lipid kinase